MLFENLDVDGDGKIDREEIMVFATKLILDKTKKSTDNEIRKIASNMETIEKFDEKNAIHLVGKSEEEIEQIIAVNEMFL